MTHFGASSQTWRSVMPTAAPIHTIRSTAVRAHPVRAMPATAV